MFSNFKEKISCLIDVGKDFLQLRRSHSKQFILANIECKMLLLSHALEKGMAFKERTSNWGGGKM